MEYVTIKDPEEALKNFLDMEGFVQDMVELIQSNEEWKTIIGKVNEAGGWLRVKVMIGQGQYGEVEEPAVGVVRAYIVPAGQIDHVVKTLAGQTVKIPQLHEHVGKTEDDFPPTPANHSTK